jgi:hypothetical protein
LVTNPIPISQHLSWSQPITPLIAGQPKIVPYPMWYNIVPSFVPMDFNVYSMYYLGIKGLNPLIFGKNKGVVASVTQLEPMPFVEQLV